MEREPNVIYKTKAASVSDISRHLYSCSNDFIPPLAKRVNIDEYAEKIHKNAITFEAWSENELIGLIAAYYPQSKIAFITNVSIGKSYSGKGISSKLLAACIKYAHVNEFNRIRLEVNINNNPAIRFYKKNNFKEVEIKGESLFLIYQII